MDYLPDQHFESVPSSLETCQQEHKSESQQSSLHEQSFVRLVTRVQSCRLCPRMEGRSRVFGPANGSIHASVLFVAEAPGRFGADRWQIPLFGDQTGRIFEELLQIAELDRRQVFITNAALCNPRDEYGNNAPPARQEIENCSQHLRDTILLLQPRYVVTLGQVALKAVRYIEPHDLILAVHVGQAHKWNERWLIPLYHPGPRARIHRPFAEQKEDYRRLRLLLQNSHQTQ